MAKKDEKKNEKKTKRFLCFLFLSNLDRNVCDIIADRNLKLAGFTLTSLALILGFYKDNLPEVSIILTPLLFSMFSFFVGSQLAHEAEIFGQILFADILQYLGVVSLMLSFGFFLDDKIGITSGIISFVVIVVALIYLFTGFFKIYNLYKSIK